MQLKNRECSLDYANLDYTIQKYIQIMQSEYISEIENIFSHNPFHYGMYNFT